MTNDSRLFKSVLFSIRGNGSPDGLFAFAKQVSLPFPSLDTRPKQTPTITLLLHVALLQKKENFIPKYLQGSIDILTVVFSFFNGRHGSPSSKNVFKDFRAFKGRFFKIYRG